MIHKLFKSPNIAAALFSSGTYRTFAKKAWRAKLFSLLREAGIKRRDLSNLLLRELYDGAYRVLLEDYRCEYVYKNALTQRILLDRHAGNACLLGEFNVAGAKVDLAIVNGTSTAYEIKTAYDRLDRLPSQLKAYSKVFDKIYVVTQASMIGGIEKDLPKHVGILELTEDLSLRCHKAAISNKQNVCSSSIFWSLRQDEYIQIVKKYLGVALDLPNTLRATAYHQLFSTIEPSLAHEGMVQALRTRTLSKAQMELVDASPSSLKYLSISKQLSNRDFIGIRLALNEVM